MKLHGTKEFPFSMETGWAALHFPAKLDVEPGSRVEVLSDTEWLAHNETNGKEVSCTHYIASFDEEKKQVIIESKSVQKMGHDHIYLTLTQPSDDHIQLEIQEKRCRDHKQEPVEKSPPGSQHHRVPQAADLSG